MRSCGMLTLAIGWFTLSSPAWGGGLDSISDELKGLIGTWDIVQFQRDNQSFDASGITWTIRKDAILVRFEDTKGGLAGIAKTPYRLSITSTSRGIDLMPTYPPNQGKTVLGIYSLEGDTLTLCLQRRAAPNRPTEFTSAPRSNCELIVLKRKKL